MVVSYVNEEVHPTLATGEEHCDPTLVVYVDAVEQRWSKRKVAPPPPPNPLAEKAASAWTMAEVVTELRKRGMLP